MTSISDSNYRQFCIELIRTALNRPSMYFRDLGEFEAILSGHAIAFQQLKVIGREASFERCFVEWLRNQHNLACSAGWSTAIEQLRSQQASLIQTFKTIVEDFFIDWENSQTQQGDNC